MKESYLIIGILLTLGLLILDLSYSKVIAKQSRELILSLLVLCPLFFLLVYFGIQLDLWHYGNGILGSYFLGIPIEEYIFIISGPFGAIVLWEALNKTFRHDEI